MNDTEIMQGIFDKVARHLLTQGVKADTEQGACRYRTDGGRMCAVGCLIPDSEYHEDMEGLGTGDLLKAYPAVLGLGFSPFDVAELGDMLMDLQLIHDQNYVEAWRESLEVVAVNYGLNADVLGELSKVQ